MMKKIKTIFILSITSDIGAFLAKHYIAQGHRVVGTYRTKAHLNALNQVNGLILFPCDVSKAKSIQTLQSQMRKHNIRWDVFISCVANPLPVMPFFKTTFDEWAASVQVNAISQMHAVHAVFPLAQKNDIFHCRAWLDQNENSSNNFKRSTHISA